MVDTLPRVTHLRAGGLRCLSVLLFLTQASMAGSLDGLRVGLHPNSSRFVFDLSEATSYRLLQLQEPERVIVDLPVTSTQIDLSVAPLQGTPVASISHSVEVDGTLHLVFDVAKPVLPKVFTLPPADGRGHRVVLDLAVAPAAASEELPKAVAAPAKPAIAMGSDEPDAQGIPDDRQTSGAGGNPAAPPPMPPMPGFPDSILKSDSEPEADQAAWSGRFGLDARLFASSPLYPDQNDHSLSLVFEPEFQRSWDSDRQMFRFRPFMRMDSADGERTRGDIRELYWSADRGDFSIKAGVDVVFWGVTESQHLVDIINQIDQVEDVDGEDRLGQPMLSIDYLGGPGTWQLYVLPWFRERTFPGPEGRLRPEPVVATGEPLYESGDEEKHIDVALRWRHYIGAWDIGLAHFHGTSREPLFLPVASGADAFLIPYYRQVDQSSLDLQATLGAWLWKLEAMHNRNHVDDFSAVVAGFEYTRFGVLDTPWDLGVLLEYNYDQRDQLAFSGLQNDVYLGARLTGNNLAGTMLLAGAIVDLDTDAVIGSVEASWRWSEDWRFSLEGRLFSNISEQELLYPLREDDYLQLSIERFF